LGKSSKIVQTLSATLPRLHSRPSLKFKMMNLDREDNLLFFTLDADEQLSLLVLFFVQKEN